MKKLTQDKLNEVIRLHSLWLEGKEEGRVANLSKVDLSNIDLSDVNFESAILKNVNFENAILRNVNFRNANLESADLSFADLEEANLCHADLRDTNLLNTNLCHADLKNANLENADLSNAILTSVNLEGTNLYRTNLFYARVDDMISVGNLGNYGRTVYYFYEVDRVICGCFDDSLDEFERQVRENYDEDSNYYVAIEVFQKTRKK